MEEYIRKTAVVWLIFIKISWTVGKKNHSATGASMTAKEALIKGWNYLADFGKSILEFNLNDFSLVNSGETSGILGVNEGDKLASVAFTEPLEIKWSEDFTEIDWDWKIRPLQVAPLRRYIVPPKICHIMMRSATIFAYLTFRMTVRILSAVIPGIFCNISRGVMTSTWPFKRASWKIDAGNKQCTYS